MSVVPVLITAPTVDVVTVAELKTMLAITSSGQDDLLELIRDAVVDTLDPAKGGFLARSLRPTTWELRLPGFYPAWPSVAICLPYPVVTSITSVKYDDSDGVEQTLALTTDYRTFGLNEHGGCRIEPPYQGSWPTARYDSESVRIRYVAGYEGDAMPTAIKSAVALAVKDLQSTSERNLFLNREETPGVLSRGWVVSPAAGEVIGRAIGNLLSTYRVWN